MSVQITANDDSEVSAIVAALEASGFKTSISITGRINAECPHSPVVGMNCRDCRIAQLQQRYSEQEADLQATGDELRRVIAHE